ncbi:MAG: 3-methyl-2-oxobutanoate hydroxymethyltransferase [Candidatus Altiarchaeota archaeon]
MTLRTAAEIKAMETKIAVLTGYDAEDARLLDSLGIDIILVGDSVGNVRLGYPDTTYVTLDDMVDATAEVASARPNALIVADMPIHTYDRAQDALEHAGVLIRAGAQAVKLEGGREVASIVEAVISSGVPVMGHIGHTPQTDMTHAIEGRDESEAERLISDARALDKAGVFAIVIELTDAEVAARVTESVSVPTIGIGAGPRTDGQVLVLDDLLGWTDFSKFPNGRPPKFLGDFWDRESPEHSVSQYIKKVRDGSYPSEKESYHVFGKR